MPHVLVILNVVKNRLSSHCTGSFVSFRMTRRFLGGLLLFLSSCTELLYVNIEQMLPPEVAPECAASSVGVVSNFSQHNVVVANDKAIVLPCDADTVKERVAQAFADAGVMDRVVVLDSLLYHPDSTVQHVFTQGEVNALCRKLNVEMIYSIDYACLVYNPTAGLISPPLNAYLCSHIYIPDRDSIQGTSILDKETLDYWINDTEEIGYLIPEIPSLLAKNAVALYLPSWKERERVFYYDRLCYELREAKVYGEEGNWEAAAEHWRVLATSKLRTHRFMAAYNMALYYEMTDSISQAIASLDLAQELAMKRSNRNGAAIQVIDTSLVKEYREVLTNRQKEIMEIEAYLTRIR